MTTPQQPLKVLVLDDSAAFRAVAERAVRKAGHEFIGVGSWVEVVRVVIRERPDAALIDVSLPVVEGYQVVEIARRHWAELVVVLTSGEPAPVLEARAAKAGADAYLTKLDVPKQLVPTIETLVRRRKTSSRRIARPASTPRDGLPRP
jgi:two-component system, NarL family, invasion response regulator UvrY